MTVLADSHPATGSQPAAPSWGPLLVVLTGTFMVMLDFFIVNVALPSIQTGLHAGAAANDRCSRAEFHARALQDSLAEALGEVPVEIVALNKSRRIWLSIVGPAQMAAPKGCWFSGESVGAVTSSSVPGLGCSMSRQNDAAPAISGYSRRRPAASPL